MPKFSSQFSFASLATYTTGLSWAWKEDCYDLETGNMKGGSLIYRR
jgi:hypothetical protein